MSVQSTPKYRNHRQPFRALALLFLMLSVLISCPLKRELKSFLVADVPVESPASAAQHPKQIITHIAPADFELACAKTVHSILDEVEPRFLFQDFDFTNPILFLAVSLAALYLSLVAGRGKTGFPNAYPAGALTSKVPLFLRHRQLVI
jgi:hypothetical protein